MRRTTEGLLGSRTGIDLRLANSGSREGSSRRFNIPSTGLTHRAPPESAWACPGRRPSDLRPRLPSHRRSVRRRSHPPMPSFGRGLLCRQLCRHSAKHSPYRIVTSAALLASDESNDLLAGRGVPLVAGPARRSPRAPRPWEAALGRGPDEPTNAELAKFYDRLLANLRRPVVRDGRWELLECVPAWDCNWTWDCFLAFA
jgi:hypothetical protein